MTKYFLATLLRYIGIGFISGAISHGFFSGQRSIIMALLGVMIFLIAEMMSEEKKKRYEIILFVIVFSVAVGMVSGGLQHFLDSPMRSLWIVPVGYFVALLMYQLQHKELPGNKIKTLIAGLITSVVLFGFLYGLLHLLPVSWFLDNHHAEPQGTTNQFPLQEDNSMMDHGSMIVDELSFIQLMIPHHQEAVDTTTELLKTTTDSALQTLGNSIVEAQQQEIAMMQSRLQQRYPDPGIDHGTSYHLMMRPTKGITESKQLDVLRTTDMIVHHEGAVQMAEKILRLSEIRPELQLFARDIIRHQGEEIATMRAWLDSQDIALPQDMDMNDDHH